jgi:hypothetical protein
MNTLLIIYQSGGPETREVKWDAARTEFRRIQEQIDSKTKTPGRGCTVAAFRYSDTGQLLDGHSYLGGL